MNRHHGNCGGRLVQVWHEGSFTYEPCGYWSVVCEECGAIVNPHTEVCPGLPESMEESADAAK